VIFGHGKRVQKATLVVVVVVVVVAVVVISSLKIPKAFLIRSKLCTHIRADIPHGATVS